MTNEDIYKYLSIIINENEYDGTWNVDEYNRIVEVMTPDFFRSTVNDLYRAVPVSNVMHSSKLLRPLIEREEITIPASGEFDLSGLSNTFAYFGALVVAEDLSDSLQSYDLVAFEEYQKRMTDLLAMPVIEHPICMITGDTLIVRPAGTDIDTEFYYIRYPETPFFDYYIDADKQLQYLDADETYTLGASEVYRDGTTSGNVSSLTVEPEFVQDFIKPFINHLLGELGISAQNQPVYQHAVQEQIIDKQS